jgi:hypothetical protein
MSWMFFNAWSFDGDLTNFDVSSVEDMSFMFDHAYAYVLAILSITMLTTMNVPLELIPSPF